MIEEDGFGNTRARETEYEVKERMKQVGEEGIGTGGRPIIAERSDLFISEHLEYSSCIPE